MYFAEASNFKKQLHSGNREAYFVCAYLNIY